MTFTQACWRSAVSILALGVATLGPARANPTVVVDAASGEVLYKDMATAPWFPASTTKLMTVYVALSKVREGKISLDTPLRVSSYAASMIPSKMGFRPGTLVTLDNALKMLMVKSPNDIAVTIAEGISGSVSGFADEMNAYAQKLGLHESHFVNPNGLPDPNHYSSARDMAMIARGLINDFPEEHDLFNIGALQFGGKLIPNHNGLLGRYPGIDGMKTGYTCAGGYNVVESATRGDRRLLVVIMGAPSTNERNLRAVTLFEKYFSDPGPGLGNVADLPQSEIVSPPDMRGQICGPGRHNAIQEAEAEDAAIGAPSQAVSAAASGTPAFGRVPERADVAAMPGSPATALGGPAALLHARDAVTPVRVFIGPVPGTNIAAVGAIEEATPGPAATAAAKAETPAALAQAPDPNDPTVGSTAPLALAASATPAALAAANTVVKGYGRMTAHGRRVPVAAPKPAAAKAAVAKAKPVVRAKPAVAARPAGKAKPVAKAAAKPHVATKPARRRPPPGEERNSVTAKATPVPVGVLTGFLGAGKTTLLNRILADPRSGATAVIVNEFGEIGIDHLLVEAVAGDMLLLTTGCICCAARGDLLAAVESLLARRDALGFHRILIETTGIADPGPILNALLLGPGLAGTARLGGVLTLVSAVDGDLTLERHEEARRQVALADRLLITKTDLMPPDRLWARLCALNPAASIAEARDVEIDAGWFDQGGATAALSPPDPAPIDHRRENHARHHHGGEAQIRASVLEAGIVEAGRLGSFVAALQERHGAALLRLKGIAALRHDPGRPAVIQAVGHLLHPATWLGAWPAGGPGTRLVVILDGVDPDEVEALWAAFFGSPAIDRADSAALMGEGGRGLFD